VGHIDGHPRLDQGSAEALGKAPIVLDNQHSHAEIVRPTSKELLNTDCHPF
jgi:hypothetical protein